MSGGAGVRWTPLSEAQKHRPSRQARPAHKRYIKEHRPGFFSSLVLSGKLDDYLADIDEQVESRLPRLVKEMAEQEGITEQLKEENQMEWVRRMNNIQNRAMEIINSEIIYA